MTQPTATRPTALILGSGMIDIITVVAADHIERMSLRNQGKNFLLIEPGHKIAADSIETHIGGGACNVAVNLARRGWHALPVIRLGADHNAEAVRAHLVGNGVDTALLRTVLGHSTGISVLLATHERNATVFVHRGANERLRSDDLPPLPADLRLLYLAPLSGDSADCLLPMAQAGKAAGAFVAANPGIKQLTVRHELLLATLPQLDLLSMNEREAAALVPLIMSQRPDHVPPPVGAQGLLAEGLSFGGFTLSLPSFCSALHRLGPRWVLITDGGRGAWLSGAGQLRHCPVLRSHVASTTGAGDGYGGTLASLLATGTAPAQAMQMAAINAAGVVSHVNTTDGLYSADALMARWAAAQSDLPIYTASLSG